MATKHERQQRVLSLIHAQSIRTQEELAAKLAENGVETTQVTLSRDLRELAIVKTPSGYEEARRLGADAPPPDAGENLRRVLSEFLQGVDLAGNLVVLKTQPGSAAAVALALDQAAWPDIVGTLAGDDTIFAATSNAEIAEKVKDRLIANGQSR